MSDRNEIQSVEQLKVEEQFKRILSINVNEYTETKKSGGTNLTYLSWAMAWMEFKKAYPSATYEIVKDEAGRPYFGEPDVGYTVYTRVTAGGLTYEMWLPVMDNNNKSMKKEAYEIKFKSGKTITVEAMDMFAVNKTIMRCLVKNLAMFGLGIYIYQGEDLPEGEVIEKSKPISQEQIDNLKALCKATGVAQKAMYEKAGVKSLKDIPVDEYEQLVAGLEGLLKKKQKVQEEHKKQAEAPKEEKVSSKPTDVKLVDEKDIQYIKKNLSVLGKTEKEFCMAYKINDVSELPKAKMKKLTQHIESQKPDDDEAPF